MLYSSSDYEECTNRRPMSVEVRKYCSLHFCFVTTMWCLHTEIAGFRNFCLILIRKEQSTYYIVTVRIFGNGRKRSLNNVHVYITKFGARWQWCCCEIKDDFIFIECETVGRRNLFLRKINSFQPNKATRNDVNGEKQ